MNAEQIEEQLMPILKDSIYGLKEIEKELIEQITYYEKTNIEWLEKNDFRPGTFSRILSSVVASKFTAQKIYDYLNEENWVEDYRMQHMPVPWKKVDYFGHMKEIALFIRFHLIHSIYSQIEATHRVIIRQKNLRTNTKPATAVSELTDTYPEDEIRFWDYIRNTIHNNGLHFPKNENYNTWSYEFKGKQYHFELGQCVDIDISDILTIMRDQIEKMINTLRHPEVLSIEITNDPT